jgi:hypothetical protein
LPKTFKIGCRRGNPAASNFDQKFLAINLEKIVSESQAPEYGKYLEPPVLAILRL